MKEELRTIDNSEEQCLEKKHILAVQKGDKQSFRFLVLAHQQNIYSIIFRHVRDLEISEELTQDTFIKAFKGINSFRAESKFSTWLTRIAINTTRNYFKSRYYKDNSNTDFLDPNSSHIESYTKQNTDTLDTEAIKKINLLAGTLSQKLREAFILCALEQKSYKEASEILGIPIGTLRSRLHKARSIIKKNYFSEQS